MGNKLWRDRRDGAARGVPRASAVLWVPGEDVLLLALPLPPMPVPQRRAAVAFAAEDRIARPLDSVHVVLGPALPDPPGHWLVAVIARDVLAAHLARLRPGPGVRVLPDTLSLPVPPPGHWAAREEGGRVILRMADGTGMVARADMLAVLHRVAGAPGIVLHGGALPEGLPSEPGGDAVVPLPAGPDLRLAAGAGGTPGLPRLLGRVAAVAAIGGLIHLGLLVAETAVLSQRLADREMALRAALAQAGLSPEGDVEATLARAMAERQGTGEAAGFLPLLTAAMAAMQPLSGQAALSDLRYGGAGGDLAMTVQAPDLGTLQAVETALTEASLRVTAGAATRGDGLAEQRLTVTR
ncbi:MAG: type II secretion system protein GspL [Gemmobacter sp.]